MINNYNENQAIGLCEITNLKVFRLLKRVFEIYFTLISCAYHLVNKSKMVGVIRKHIRHSEDLGSVPKVVCLDYDFRGFPWSLKANAGRPCRPIIQTSKLFKVYTDVQNAVEQNAHRVFKSEKVKSFMKTFYGFNFNLQK